MRTEYEQILATVQKAASSGRQLSVDKKGNLKCRGAFSGFFLRLRVSCYSDERFKKYINVERYQVRATVLEKLEGIARKSRKEAILDFRQGSLNHENEATALDDFLDQYIELSHDGLKGKLRAAECSTPQFNSEVLDFLRLSKTATYVKKPECPDFYDPGKPLSKQEGLTAHQKFLVRSYQGSMKIYELTAATKRIIEQTGFHEPPKPFPEASQNRVQFFSKTHEQSFKDMETLGGSEQPEEILNKMDEVTYVHALNSKGKLPRFSSKKTWNQADFKAQSEKRLSSEARKRERLGQALPQQGDSAKAVNFLCFLRKSVQTQLAKRGDLPEQLQPLFNENSAVSVRGSAAIPDRLIPSKKLVARALDICMSDTGIAPATVAEKKVPTFSDDVKVREIDSRHVDKGLLQVAVKEGQLETSPVQERKILGYERDTNPTTAEEALDGSTYNYEVEDLPEDFEKHVPGGGKIAAAVNSGDEDISFAEPGQAGGGEEMVGVTGDSWLNEQYAAWRTSEQS